MSSGLVRCSTSPLIIATIAVPCGAKMSTRPCAFSALRGHEPAPLRPPAIVRIEATRPSGTPHNRVRSQLGRIKYGCKGVGITRPDGRLGASAGVKSAGELNFVAQLGSYFPEVGTKNRYRRNSGTEISPMQATVTYRDGKLLILTTGRRCIGEFSDGSIHSRFLQVCLLI